MLMTQTGRVYHCTVYYRARYYDQTLGRFISEDPTGFKAGVNFYKYADNDPIDGSDPTGLVTLICTKPLHGLGSAGPWAMKNIQWLPLFHEYVCVNGKCGGQDRSGNPFFSNGKPSDDNTSSGSCTLLDMGGNCFEACMQANIDNPTRPKYSLQRWPGQNCQQWVSDVIQKCSASCSQSQGHGVHH